MGQNVIRAHRVPSRGRQKFQELVVVISGHKPISCNCTGFKVFSPTMMQNNIFASSASATSCSKGKQRAAVIVDPMSTGAVLAQHLVSRGYLCVRVLSQEYPAEVLAMVPPGCAGLEYHATIQHGDSVEETAKAIASLPDIEVLAIMPGLEFGVNLSDELCEVLGMRGNRAQSTRLRRDKYLMGEAIRSSGTRAVIQGRVSSSTEVDEFIAKHKPSPFKLVVKPIDDAGSQDVALCSNKDEVQAALKRIQSHTNLCGNKNASALVQEYLEGTEYVVDTVSRGGKHKVTAMWRYDKRKVNGGAFVYFGLYLEETSAPDKQEMIEYVKKCLDALEVKDGPGHSEVIYTSTGPCLVEVGARCHGGEGGWVDSATQCIGHSQVSATLDAYLNPTAFDALPEQPPAFKGHCCEVNLVSYNRGQIVGVNLDEIKSLKSYAKHEMFIGEGAQLVKTVDLLGSPGSVFLLHEKKETVQKDCELIRQMEVDGAIFTLRAMPEVSKSLDAAAP
jgi:biotin carboxylase